MRTLQIILLISLVSCAPIKRHARLVKKYPFVHTKEVKYIHDTIRIHSSTSDTIVHNNTLIDTIHLVKDRLDVKVFRVRDSIFIQGECKDTTIYKTYEYNEYKTTKPFVNYPLYIFLIVIVILILLILRKLLK